MGVLSRFFGRSKTCIHTKIDQFSNSVSRHLKNLKEDFDLQKKWVNQLHDFSLKIHKDHHNHRQLTEEDLSKVKSWINHLYYNQGKHQRDLQKVEDSVSQMVSLVNSSMSDMYVRLEKLEQSNKNYSLEDVQDLLRKHAKHTEKQLQDFKAEHKRIEYQSEPSSVPHSYSQHSSPSYPHPSQPYSQPQTHSHSQAYSLSNPENKLLNILLDQPDPISYAKISELTGNSVNTVRVVMNNLKKKGLVEENILPTGEKLFSVKNGEKVRKLYNITRL